MKVCANVTHLRGMRSRHRTNFPRALYTGDTAGSHRYDREVHCTAPGARLRLAFTLFSTTERSSPSHDLDGLVSSTSCGDAVWTM